MHRRKAASTTHAAVANTGTNDASRALYTACEFEPWRFLDDYVKPAPVR